MKHTQYSQWNFASGCSVCPLLSSQLCLPLSTDYRMIVQSSCTILIVIFNIPIFYHNSIYSGRGRDNFLSLGCEVVLEGGWSIGCLTAWKCGKGTVILPDYYFPWMDLGDKMFRNLGTKKIGAEVFGEVWNVVLEENSGDKMVRESS